MQPPRHMWPIDPHEIVHVSMIFCRGAVVATIANVGWRENSWIARIVRRLSNSWKCDRQPMAL